MTITAWVAASTGLPSICSSGAVRVTCGNRVLADGSAPVLLSDALAEPGAPTTYKVGDASYTLTRRADGARYAILTRLNGRGIPGVWYLDTGDPQKWTSDRVVYPSGGVRWGDNTPLRTGAGRFIAWDPTQIPTMWDLLQAKEPLVVAASAQVPGASPIRVIAVDDVGPQRIAPWGATQWDVSWTELPLSRYSGAAPVTVWGEWDAYDHSWQARTVLELARLIAGMPS